MRQFHMCTTFQLSSYSLSLSFCVWGTLNLFFKKRNWKNKIGALQNKSIFWEVLREMRMKISEYIKEITKYLSTFGL